ncbi:cytochrome P450 [Mycena polygramma]|nr:cytochrome P450 [Mycena polygramma]
MSLALYSSIAFAGSLSLLLILRKRRRASKLPPGPPGLPIIGHLLRMPSTDAAFVFHEWSKIYGDVMRLEVLGQVMIILDSYEAAVDLLDKRGLIYSDRPAFTLYQLFGWEAALAFLPYGKQFTRHRAMHQAYLGRHKAEDFKSIQTQEARSFVHNVIKSSPDKYEACMSRFAVGIITQIVAGHRITSDDDPYLHISHNIREVTSQSGTPGGSPIDFFPILQHFPPWFPGARHIRVANIARPKVRELHDYPFREVVKQRELGEAKPSFILSQLETGQAEDDDVKGAAAIMFGAGEDTTWSALSIFILAMILHPECQLKAQKEIDSVVGDLRLPDFGDRERLPFVEGILQETLRWRSGVPLGVPHRVTEDDVYRGMLIPKGSLVISNIRGMSLDKKVYSDPTSFYPERFLPRPAGRGEPYFNDTVFGFGRRICTGKYVADNSLWIAIASVLAACKIENAVDANGNIIVPEALLSDGLTSHPKDTRCVILPRSPGAEALIFDAAA